MRIGLFLGQLGLRGTYQFVYQLAEVCETDLSHRVMLITPEQQTLNEDVTAESQSMFRSRFFVVFKGRQESLDDIARRYGLDLVYVSKWGVQDDLITLAVPCIVHAIFDCRTPHGDAYVAISEHMRRKCDATCDVLPFCPQLLPPTRSLRRDLGIPDDAFVFGRHGGYDQFDIAYAQRAVADLAQSDAHVFFLFMNTRQFMPSSPRVVFMPGESGLQARSDFVHACDAMLHARSDGETFGLSCAEFSLANKPVITTSSGDQAHVTILGPRVFVASGVSEYLAHMRTVVRLKAGGSQLRWDAYKRFDRASLASKFSQLIGDAQAAHRRRRGPP